jgi:2',3'-cyclic-nucleotide 2'-phosphodiesterase/3'-nucleotidase
MKGFTMHRHLARSITVVATVVTLLWPIAGWTGETGGTARLTILHTSDMHGTVLPYNDFTNQPSTRGSLLQVATIVDRVRAEVDHPVLVLDSGDTIQGTPFEQFVAVRWGGASPTITAMNEIGYDAMAVGNHEFNFGLEVLRRAESLATFPMLSANTLTESSGQPAFAPHTVLERGGVRIGILGLITPNVPGWEKPANYEGLTFEPMDEAARRWVPVLKNDLDCDLVVVLAHTGFEYDRDNPAEDRENYLGRLSAVPGIDLVLSGHTHNDMPPQEIGGVIVSQPWARARRLTRIDLELARGDDGWRIASWQGSNLPTGGDVPDAGLMDRFAADHAKVRKELDGPIGEVTGMVTAERCRLEDCALLDFLHEVQLEASGADLSLASLLAYSTPELESGPVTWRWIHGFYVYPNTLAAVRLTGAQIRDILEHTARYYDGLECGDNGCTVLADPEIPHYNVDSMSGLSYRIDPTRPEGSRIRDLRYGGGELDPEATFTVACNSYRTAGGGNFPHLADAELVWWSSEEMTELIGSYLERHETWRPSADGNWWIGRDIVGEAEMGAD